MQYKCVCTIITQRYGAVLEPGDDIDLTALREHAIVYHDDNVRGIPHAHIVVNNANLRTGYRMQTKHFEDLNRDLQDMARERGLSGLSNDRAPESPSKARGRAGADQEPQEHLPGPGREGDHALGRLLVGRRHPRPRRTRQDHGVRRGVRPGAGLSM